MNTTKELIEFLDDCIHSAQVNIDYCENRHPAGCVGSECIKHKNRKAHLTQIKEILEDKEAGDFAEELVEVFPSESDEELVEKILQEARRIMGFGVLSSHNTHRYDISFKDKIRSLLQSRQSTTMTRDEIFETMARVMTLTPGQDVKTGKQQVDEWGDFFKSKGIGMREK